MKRLPMIAVLIASALLTACSSFPMGAKTAPDAAEVKAAEAAASKKARDDTTADRLVVQDEAGSVVVQKVGFRHGVSSASVERLAKQSGCNGRTGAGLVTEKGPVEVYRMQCENGATFVAKCELRQCRPMR